MKSLTLLFILTVFVSSFHNATAQARSQADISISSVTLNNSSFSRPASIATKTGAIQTAPDRDRVTNLSVRQDLKCSITVHSENDDDAYQTVLTVVLPVEVSVVSLPPNATVYKASPDSPFAGYIIFSLGHMTVGQNITVEFTFTKSKFGNKVGAYAYSGTPDPNPANNYKDASF